jgi:hypothetical protein
MKLAYIVWEDASELDVTAWAVHEEEFSYIPVLCKQVGWVIYDGPEGIILTQAVTSNGEVARRNQIPKHMIRSIEWLTEPSFLTEVENE